MQRETFIEIAEPYFEPLCQCVFEGIAGTHAVSAASPEWSRSWDLGLIAFLHHRHIWQKLTELFAGHPNVYMFRSDDVPMLSIDNRVAMRVKFVDEQRRPRNIRTKHNDDLMFGQLPLENVPDCPRITLGYRTNQLGEPSLVTGVYQTSPKRVIWYHDIFGGANAQQLPFDFPTPITPIEPNAPTVRMSPKLDRITKESKAE